MDGIRIVDIPNHKMVISIQNEREQQVDSNFDKWFSAKENDIFPRDFMWFDSAMEKLIWGYSIDNVNHEAHAYTEIDFEGGLYAAAISIDEDDRDGERVYNGISDWLSTQEHLELDISDKRSVMFHVISSERVKKALGYAQLDVFVPIKIV